MAGNEREGADVMLVDDNPTILDLYAHSLMRAGFRVQACNSSGHAIETLRGGAKPDLILFDITMPGEDGFGFLQRVRGEQLAPDAKLVALSNAEADVERMQKIGIKRFFVKARLLPSEVVDVARQELGQK